MAVDLLTAFPHSPTGWTRQDVLGWGADEHWLLGEHSSQHEADAALAAHEAAPTMDPVALWVERTLLDPTRSIYRYRVGLELDGQRYFVRGYSDVWGPAVVANVGAVTEPMYYPTHDAELIAACDRAARAAILPSP